MARESRRRREERRFGKPERLVDVLGGDQLQPPPWVPEDEHMKQWRDGVEGFKGEVRKAKVIEASNIAEYLYLHGKRAYSRDDFPCCAPPFATMFIEANAVEHSKGWFGWLVIADSVLQGRTLNGETHSLISDKLPETGWVLECTLVWTPSVGTMLICPVVVLYYAINQDGRIVSGPHFAFPLTCCIERSEENGKKMENLAEFGKSLAVTLLLTLSFLNCKGTRLDAVERPQALNRLRERNGHQPFLRYHTINIEPMKAVLRTEGNIETEGLKRALHICRGHFSTYSEERPLFGKVAGTFWVPAHVRGSAKQGVVISDYNVKGPNGGAG